MTYNDYNMWKKQLLLLSLLQWYQQGYGFVSYKPNSNAFRQSHCGPTTELHAKRKIIVNPNLEGVASISSNGLLTFKKKAQEEARRARDEVKSNLGVPSKKRKGSGNISNSPGGSMKKLSKKAEILARQRNGSSGIDSTLQAGLALPEDQAVEVQVSQLVESNR